MYTALYSTLFHFLRTCPAPEYIGFALPFMIRINENFSTNSLSILNTTFLSNENAVFVYAILASGHPRVDDRVAGMKMSLNQCNK